MVSSPSPVQSEERSLIDQDTSRAIARLRFSERIERGFRSYYLDRNLPRARFATAIYLVFIVIVTAINILGGMAPLTEPALEPIYLLRIGAACPALVVILAATSFAWMQRHYQAIASIAVVVAGMSVMTISGIAAAAGQPQFQMGDVLVIVYATLFLGLLFRAVVFVAVTLVLAFVAIGWFLGVPSHDLGFAAAVLFVTALMSVVSAGRVEQLVRTSFIETQALNNIAERDGLSGLYNRRMFDTLTSRLWQQAQREHESLQIILVDIDHFKPFNDHYGHQAGDHCIRQVASIIARAARRPLDFCARYGGEEFALVLYAPSAADPAGLAEQIRRETMALAIPHTDSGVADVITVSVGSSLAESGTRRSLAGLIQSADEALYRAKQAGRNHVVHIDAGHSSTGSFRVAAIK